MFVGIGIGIGIEPDVAAQGFVRAVEGAQPIDDVDPNQSSSGRPVEPLIGIAVLGAVLVFGLRAIKRQRDEGRRSKLPPIG